jgi:hypothetical protein
VQTCMACIATVIDDAAAIAILQHHTHRVHRTSIVALI